MSRLVHLLRIWPWFAIFSLLAVPWVSQNPPDLPFRLFDNVLNQFGFLFSCSWLGAPKTASESSFQLDFPQLEPFDADLASKGVIHPWNRIFI